MPTIENGEISLHYERTGAAGADVLMFSNSLGSNLHMWDKVLPAFESRYQILRYDMRGHGKSSVPAGPYTIDQLGGDVLSLLDHLGVEKVNFCGLSIGGMLAMWLGIRAPQRVKRLILANTSARIGTRELWDQRISTAQTAGMASLALMTLDRWFTPSYKDEHPDEMAMIRAMAAATDPRGYVACCQLLRDTDLRGEVSTIIAPALIIGATHDPATPPSDGRAIHAALPGSHYVELNASHLSAWERADEFAAAAVKFLSEGRSNHG